MTRKLAERIYPEETAIERAYVRGLREGERRGQARRLYLAARVNELVIRLKTAKGELRRRDLKDKAG